jgi:hypothetical protein
MKRSLSFVTVMFCALLAQGCFSRQHLTPTHGRSFRTTFAAQQVNPNGAEGRANKGLDSQEAALVTQTYRQSLVPKGTSQQDQPAMILLNPGAQNAPHMGTSSMPPPSVPR